VIDGSSVAGSLRPRRGTSFKQTPQAQQKVVPVSGAELSGARLGGPVQVKEIEGRSALSLGDVQSVLSNLMEALPVFLKLGQSVNLKGFGTFRISVTSDGTATAEELNARHVKGVKLLFLPSADLKRNLEGIAFEVPTGAPETPTA
jgi:nucleoid DNA-binding protein